MNINRYLEIPRMADAETGSAEAPEVIEPIAEVAAEPVAEVQPEPQPDPPAVAEPAAEPHGNRGQTPWFMKEIPQLREEKRVEKAAREAAELRAANLQAIIERMQAGGASPEPAAPAPSSPRQNNQEIESLVEARASRKLFDADCTAVANNWKAEAPAEFQDGLNALGVVGLLPMQDGSNTEFMLDLFGVVDKNGAHKILDKLAKDPEKAASLVGMDSRRRIAELTRMADAPKTEAKPAVVAEVKPAAISKAPAPSPRLAPLAAAPDVDPRTPDGNEKLSDKAWEAWYKNKYQKQA